MLLDQSLFDPSSIDSSTRTFVAQLERDLAGVPDMTKLPPQEIRDARERGEGIFGPIALSEDAVDREIEGPGGRMRLRMHLVPEPRGLYFHIHGGGWVLGAAHHRDRGLARLADETQVSVASVDYRLAPEHPYPAGPDDCEAAALWLVSNAREEFGTDRIVIGGESAGAHLSVVTLLRLRDRHGWRGFRAANLVYGVYDLGLTPSATSWGDRYLILSTPVLRWFTDHFVPPELRRDPDVSPLFADLSGLPPALFTVGTLDPLLDDSVFMAHRWAAAGNRAELAVYPGGVHSFDYFEDHTLGQQALERTFRFISDALLF